MKMNQVLRKWAERNVENNINSACTLWFYQPTLPAACNKFKKITNATAKNQ